VTKLNNLSPKKLIYKNLKRGKQYAGRRNWAIKRNQINRVRNLYSIKQQNAARELKKGGSCLVKDGTTRAHNPVLWIGTRRGYCKHWRKRAVSGRNKRDAVGKQSSTVRKERRARARRKERFHSLENPKDKTSRGARCQGEGSKAFLRKKEKNLSPRTNVLELANIRKTTDLTNNH